MGFPCGLAGKESDCNVGDLGSVPGLERSPGERNGYPLQYSDLENSMDCIVYICMLYIHIYICVWGCVCVYIYIYK